MTVSAQTPINRSAGNGVTTVFPYNFKVLSAADLEVSIDGVVKTLTTHYTLSGVGTDSGDVTFLTPPANMAMVVRRRNMAYTRTVDYQDQGELPTDTLDDDQDSAVLMCQQLGEGLSRAVQVPPESSTDPAMLIDELLAASAVAVAAATAAGGSSTSAAASAAAAAGSAASTGLPALAGKTLNHLRVKADETGYEARTPAQTRTDIGATATGGAVFTATNAAAARTAIGSPAVGVLLTVTAFVASGTLTTNAATKTMIGEVVGGGGGGGGTSATGVANSGGGGGQGEIAIFSISTPLASYAVTVGAGGAGGLNSGGNGGTGGVSSLGAAVTAFGGVGGEGDGGQSGGYGGLGGLAGTGAILALRGAPGAAGSPGGSFGNSGSGGGAGGGNGIRNSSAVGVPGVRGGGGSGAAGTTATGGAGGAGYVIVWEYA